MSLELWIGEGGYFFVDYFSGCSIQVGQAFQDAEDQCSIEVNNDFLTAPDLETAKRLFVEKYERSRIQLSLGSFDTEAGNASDFTVVDLSPLEKLVGRIK
jgi:hypothetical protein